jgi:hypothetical protein
MNEFAFGLVVGVFIVALVGYALVNNRTKRDR